MHTHTHTNAKERKGDCAEKNKMCGIWFFILNLMMLSQAQLVHLFIPSLDMPIQIETQYLYKLRTPLPSKGSVYINDEELMFPYVFGSLSSLSYKSNNKTEFQTLEPQMVEIYDFIRINIVVFNVNSTLEFNTTINVTISDVALPQLQIQNKTVTVTSTTTTFLWEVSSIKSTYGTVDGMLSNFAMTDPQTGLFIGAFEFINESCTTLGCLTNCSTNATLLPNIKYKTNEFCFAKSHNTSGLEKLSVNAYGRNETFVHQVWLQLQSFLLQPNCTNCAVKVVENETVYFTTPIAELFLDQYIPILVRFESIPSFCSFTYMGEMLTFDMVLTLPLVAFQLNYSLPYFDEFILENETVVSTFVNGAPIKNAFLLNRNLTLVYYIPSLGFSMVQTVVFTVQRRLKKDVLSVCSICVGESDSIGGFPVFLTFSDGRLINEANIVFIHLPSHGVLTNNNITVLNNTEINARDLMLFYEPETNFYTRYIYDSWPNATYSLKSDTDEPPSSNTPDRIVFEVRSLWFPEVEPVMGMLQLEVSFFKENQLTACPRESNETNPWGESCRSFGFETNSLFGESVVTVYLDVQNVFIDETVEFVVTTVPLHGNLFVNTGTFENPIFDRRAVVLGQVLSSPWLVYIGEQDYSNLAESEYVNILGEPFGGCEYLYSQGCPDSFIFFARTNQSRTSQMAVYQIYLSSLQSEPVMLFPDFIQAQPDETIINLKIQYSDDDNGESMVMLQIIAYEVLFGFPNATLNGLPACSSNVSCTTEFYMPIADKLVGPLLQHLCARPNENSSSEEQDVIFVTVYKRPQTGGIDRNLFFKVEEDDIAITADVSLFRINNTISDDYYFSGCEIDDCEEYYKQDLALIQTKENNQLIETIGLGIGCGLILILLVIFIKCYCGERFSDKQTVKSVESTESTETTESAEITEITEVEEGVENTNGGKNNLKLRKKLPRT